MSTRIARPFLAVGCLALMIALALPLLKRAPMGDWGRAASSGAQLTLLLELDVAPLAVAGRGWDHARRQAHLATIKDAQSGVAAAVEARGGTVLARFSHASAGLAVAVSAEAALELAALPNVAAVLPVSDYATAQVEPPASAASLAELSALIGADQVRGRGNDGRGVELAIVDSGLDYSHSKLGGPGTQAAYNRAVCGSAEITPGQPGCADGMGAPPAELFPNAKVRGGADYLGDRWPNPDPRCGTRQVCAAPDDNPIDLSGHGTHVADIAAGLPSTTGGDDSGVAPGAQLWAFKACNGAAERCEGVALLAAIDGALDLDGSDQGACTPGVTPGCRAYDPADVITLALSYSYGQPEDALSLFADIASYYGSLVVASAGNGGDKPYIVGAPASAAAALAVGESLFPDSAAPLLALPGPPQDELDMGSQAATEQLATGEWIAPNSSRGPRIADNALKPDLAAPGAVRSALAGGGTATAPFGGSSGAAPVAAGVAALVIQELEEFGVLDRDPGLGVQREEFPRLSVAPLVKAVLMNHASAELRTAEGALAAYAQQGAGRVSAIGSFSGRTIAWDATALIALLNSTPDLTVCSVRPYIDLFNYIFFKITPPCAAAYPFGEPFFQAWNAQTGSLSFGYQPTVAAQELSRQVVVYNYSRSPRSYSLSTSLRSAEDLDRGVNLSVEPASLTLGPSGFEVVTLTMSISPGDLRDWSLNGGSLGASGSASCASATPEVDCPSFGLFEIDGNLLIDGGTNNRVSVPVHVLPRKAADVTVSRELEDQLILSNSAAFKAGRTEIFALVDHSPNKCDTRDGVCVDVNYSPGARPGSDESPVDIADLGLRSSSVPGLNASYGLPEAPAGALADELVEFAVTVYDAPYRASPNLPARFEIHLDANIDGVTDYVAYNADAGGGGDGRSAVFVRDANSADGTRPTRFYRFVEADFNTQSWVLPVPAAAVDLRSDQPFRFFVRALDAYFDTGASPRPWDCSPNASAGCGADAHIMQTGALRFRPATPTLTVPPLARAALFFGEDAGGVAGSPSQLGLLLLHQDAPIGRGYTHVPLR